MKHRARGLRRAVCVVDEYVPLTAALRRGCRQRERQKPYCGVTTSHEHKGSDLHARVTQRCMSLCLCVCVRARTRVCLCVCVCLCLCGCVGGCGCGCAIGCGCGLEGGVAGLNRVYLEAESRVLVWSLVQTTSP